MIREFVTRFWSPLLLFWSNAIWNKAISVITTLLFAAVPQKSKPLNHKWQGATPSWHILIVSTKTPLISLSWLVFVFNMRCLTLQIASPFSWTSWSDSPMLWTNQLKCQSQRHLVLLHPHHEKSVKHACWNSSMWGATLESLVRLFSSFQKLVEGWWYLVVTDSNIVDVDILYQWQHTQNQ